MWKQTASAARLSARNAEDPVAARAPAVGSVGVLSVSSCSLLSLAFIEACSFVCPRPRKWEKIAGTQSLTSRLASVWPENVHFVAPNVGRFDEQCVELPPVAMVDARCVRDEEYVLR